MLNPRDKDVQSNILKHINWYSHRMRPTAEKLTNLKTKSKAHGEQPPTPEAVQKEQVEFFSKLLPQLDKELIGKKYCCGDEVTIIDIQYYNQISTIVNLTKHELKESDLPNLAVWYNNRMGKLPELMKMDKKLKEIIARYNF